MTSIRYVSGKVWANYLCAVGGGVVVVIVVGSLWSGSALIGGVAGMVAVVAMLLPGVIKRGSRPEPIVTIDARGVTVDLLGIGTIPWDRIRTTEIAGIPWVTGQRLIVEYRGTAPKAGFKDKLNWGLQAKQKGEVVRLTLGFIDLTDQPKSTIESALSQTAARTA
jgi:hypothetical protein